jgi:hypothetical protein
VKRDRMYNLCAFPIELRGHGRILFRFIRWTKYVALQHGSSYRGNILVQAFRFQISGIDFPRANREVDLASSDPTLSKKHHLGEVCA